MPTEAEQQLSRMLLASLVNRMSLGNVTSYGGLRDVWTALGYPQDGTIKFEHYWLKYKRQDVAAAIIEKPVEGAWRQLPIVQGVEDNDRFKDAFNELDERLGVYHTLVRADIMSRIGQYSALLIGFDDGAENLADPVVRARGVLYLQPYLQQNADINSYVRDKNDPRFGLPETYTVKVSQNENDTASTLVHHSRILHISDTLMESNVFGIPALERVYNRLQDIELISGGSAEMFWRGAFPGMAFKVQEGASMTDADRVTLEEEIQNYLHDFQRYLKLQGLDVEQLSTQVADPEKHIDLQLKLISVATGIPKRILEGAEMGELASSQDSESWNNKCDTRRKNHCENGILRPFIDRLIEVGVLQEPAQGYVVEWPDLESQSDEAKAKVGRDRTEAIVKYADSPGAPLVVPPLEFLRDILELAEDKVERIIEELDISPLGKLEDQEDDETGFQEEM